MKSGLLILSQFFGKKRGKKLLRCLYALWMLFDSQSLYRTSVLYNLRYPLYGGKVGNSCVFYLLGQKIVCFKFCIERGNKP